MAFLKDQRRKISNYLISSNEQLKLAGLSFLCLVTGLGIQSSLLLVLIRDSGIDNPELSFSILVSFAAVTLVVGFFIVLVNIVYTHRIYGSLFAARNAIRTLLKGEKVEQIVARPTDQTGELIDTVNELIRHFNNK
jgi:hypothetical protein